MIKIVLKLIAFIIVSLLIIDIFNIRFDIGSYILGSLICTLNRCIDESI